MLRSRQGCLSGSVPSGGLCTDLPQWIQAPACLGSPSLQPPLSFYLPWGPKSWGHPTPLSTRQRHSLTDPHHLWAEGLVWPLEIPSLKPAWVCFSWCRGCSRSGLGWAPHLQRDRTFCERFAGPSVGGGTHVTAGDPVPRSLLGSFPHGVAAAAGLPSAPSPGAQSAVRRTPRERFAGPTGTEISLAPIFHGLRVQNSP